MEPRIYAWALLFSEHVKCGPARWPDHQLRSSRTAAEYRQHIALRHRDATRCGAVARAREVKKDGTAMALHPRALVVVSFNHNVIDVIGPPECLMGCSIGNTHTAVIVSVTHCLTPTPTLSDGEQGNAGPRPQNFVLPEITLPQFPYAYGTCAIALPLPVFATGTPQSTGKRHRTHGQAPTRCTRTDRANVKICDCFPHSLLFCQRPMKTPLNILELSPIHKSLKEASCPPQRRFLLSTMMIRCVKL